MPPANPKYAPRELKTVRIDEIHTIKNQKLNSYLYVPSRIDSFSMCVEYVYNWFMQKFKKQYWKSVSIDGHNPLDEMRQWNIKDWIRRPKPRLAVNAKLDLSFNRDHIDEDYTTLMAYINKSRDMNCFFNDPNTQIKLGIVSRLNLVNYVFKMQVQQQAEQFELYDMLHMACRAGATLTKYVDVDFLVPDGLIKRLADDLHFEWDNENRGVKDPTAFLEYLNKYSVMPFLYKLREVNRRVEFYIRMKGLMCHFRDIEIEADDGEREGMVMTNFGLELRFNVRMPSPRFYVYYSTEIHEQVVYRDPDTGEKVAAELMLMDIPIKNSRNWLVYIEGDFLQDHMNDYMKLSLYDMFRSQHGTANDILDTIEYCRLKRISPEVFMEIKVFNGMKERDVYVDWDRMGVMSKEKFEEPNSHIVVYADTVFMHSACVELRGSIDIDNRVSESKG